MLSLENRYLFILAWKTILRHPGRSLFIGLSVSLAMMVAVWVAAYMRGINLRTEKAVVGNNIGNYQWQEKSYSQSGDAETPRSYTPELAAQIKSLGVTKFSPELILDAHISTPEGDAALSFIGVIPELHREFIPLKESTIQGDYESIQKLHFGFIGKELAALFKLQVGDKLVLNFQDVDGALRSELLTVGGIFHYSSKSFESKMVYVSQKTWQDFYFKQPSDDRRFHRIPFLASEDQTKFHLPALELRSWKDLNPELAMVVEYNQLLVIFFFVVIGITITLTIVIPVQMMWQERLPELTTMTIMGTSAKKFWRLGTYETGLLLSFAILFSAASLFLLIGYQSIHGVDFSFMSRGIDMERSGVKLSWVIQPDLTWTHLGFAFLSSTVSLFASFGWAMSRTLRKLEVSA